VSPSKPRAADFERSRFISLSSVMLMYRLARSHATPPQATRIVGKDPNDAVAPFDLLVESLEHIGRFHDPVAGPGRRYSKPNLIIIA
jgi:hypothetical protein